MTATRLVRLAALATLALGGFVPAAALPTGATAAPPVPQVCLYSGKNWLGGMVCLKVGVQQKDQGTATGGFASFKSAKVQGAAALSLCSEANFKNCFVITHDVRMLTPSATMIVRSYIVTIANGGPSLDQPKDNTTTGVFTVH